MSANTSVPVWQVFDDNGIPLAGAKLYTYLVGSSTITDTYTDYLETNVAEWPIVFDSAGRSEVWLKAGKYKMALTTSDNVPIWTIDGVSSNGGSENLVISVNTVVGATDSLMSLTPGLSAIVTAQGYNSVGDLGGGSFRWDDSATSSDNGVYIKPSSLTVSQPGRWVRLLNDSYINARWYGCKGDATDDTIPMGNALTFCVSNSYGLLIPEGTFYLTSDPGFVYDVAVKFDPLGSLIWTNLSDVEITPVIIPQDKTQHFDCPDFAPTFPNGTTVMPQWFSDIIGAGADDLQPFKDALQSIRLGGTLYIPEGEYILTEGLIILDNITVKGDGNGSQIDLGKGAKTWYNTTACFYNDTDASCTSNVDIGHLRLIGDGSIESRAMKLNLKNSKIHDMHFENVIQSGIILGGAKADGSNVEFSDNYLLNVGSGTPTISVVSGTDVRILRNTLHYSVDPAVGIWINSQVGNAPITNVMVKDNIVENADIHVQGATSGITNVTIDGNKLASNVLTVSPIKIDGAFGPAGKVSIVNNLVTTDSSIAQAIDVGPTTHNADCYEISNNQINLNSPLTTASGILLTGIPATVETIITNNSVSTDATTTCQAISESSCVGVQYGLNPTVKFNTPFNGVDSTQYYPGNLYLSNGLSVGGRLQDWMPAAAVPAGADTTVTNGNVFHISGSSSISRINKNGWQNGSQIQLIFDADSTVLHDATSLIVGDPSQPIFLESNMTFYPGRDAVLNLVLDGTRWLQTGKSAANTLLKGDTSAVYGKIGGSSQFDQDDYTTAIHYEADIGSNPTVVTLWLKGINELGNSSSSTRFQSTNIPLPPSIRPTDTTAICNMPIINTAEQVGYPVISGAAVISNSGVIAFGQYVTATDAQYLKLDEWPSTAGTQRRGFYDTILTYSVWH